MSAREDDPKEIVTIHHPETGSVTTAVRRSFERIWKAKGYVLGDGSDKTPAAADTSKAKGSASR